MAAQQSHVKHLVFSLLLHVVFLAVLVIGFEFHSQMPVLNHSDKNDVISAVAMMSPSEPKKVFQKPVNETPAPKNIVPPPKPAPAPVKVVEKTVIEPPKKTETIALPDKKQKKQQEDLLQKSLLADLKKETEHQKKIKQKKLQAAFEKEMRELKAEELAKEINEMKQVAEKEKRVAKAQALEKQIQEHINVTNERSQEAQGEVDKYKALILQVISQHWLVPSGVNKKLSAELLIKLAPGGVVLDVQLTRSSGDESLDRSARAAVFKASPLPVPADADAFESFRHFVLKVRPVNLLGADSVVG